MGNLTNLDIRPVKNCLVPTRGEMIGRQFIVDGSKEMPLSRWEVRRCEGNKFFCVRLRPYPNHEIHEKFFDIGRVIFTWMKIQEELRDFR